MIFAWDDENIRHLRKHAVTKREAEYVIESARSPFPALPASQSVWSGARLKMNMPKKKDDNELAKLDRWAKTLRYDDTRPMSAKERKEWQAAKRTGKRGRPRLPADKRCRIVPISIAPALLAAADELAKKQQKSRSQLVSEGLKAVLRVGG